MKKIIQFVGALPFLVAIFINAFVDLGHKIVIQNTIYKLYDGAEQVVLTAIINGLILLPFILLMCPAGYFSDRFRKTIVMRFSAWAAVACTLSITIFYYLGWFWAAFAMTFLLAVQSAIFSPAKLGYIKELFGKERLGEANGAASSVTIVAILAGTFVFTIFFELLFNEQSSTKSEVLKTIAPIGFILVANAVIELIMVYKLKSYATPTNIPPFNLKSYLSGRIIIGDLSPLRQNTTIRPSIIGLTTFWGAGQMMLASFPAFIKEQLAVNNTIVVQGVLACTGIGIAIGSVVAGKLSRQGIETGLISVGAFGICAGLCALPQLANTILFAINFLFIGICGGLFIVPLNALIQLNAKSDELGKTLAANNWVQNVAMLTLLIITILFTQTGWSTKSLLLFTAAVAIAGCSYTLFQMPESVVRLKEAVANLRRK